MIEGEGSVGHDPPGYEGDADAVLFEAVMTLVLEGLACQTRHEFPALGGCSSVDAWSSVTLGSERQCRRTAFLGCPGRSKALDFFDFLFVCRDDLPEDVAYVISAIMCETPEILERQYAHLPPKISPVTYPLDPRKIAKTSIPLHPGAKAYYAAQGFVD